MCYDDYDYMLRIMCDVYLVLQIDINSWARTMKISKNVNALLK